jgi:hypothetical protein
VDVQNIWFEVVQCLQKQIGVISKQRYGTGAISCRSDEPKWLIDLTMIVTKMLPFLWCDKLKLHGVIAHQSSITGSIGGKAGAVRNSQNLYSPVISLFAQAAIF